MAMTQNFNNYGNGEASSFDSYVNLATHFADFLIEKLKFEVTAIHSNREELLKKTYSEMPLEVRLHKQSVFEKFSNFYQDFISKGYSHSDKKKALTSFLRFNGMVIGDESSAVNAIDDDHIVEIYDLQFTQIYRSPDFYHVTNHAIMDMELCEWPELFTRADDVQAEQMQQVMKVFRGEVDKPIFVPLNPHTVKELNSPEPLSSQAEEVLYAPVYGPDAELCGILHVFKVVNARSLNFKVLR